MTENVTWQSYQPRELRWRELGQRPAIVWLTGLPGSGKTTIASIVDRELVARMWHTMVLDGDNLRHGLNCNLGFSSSDRAENVRRTAEVARLMAEAGLITIVALVSPARAEREMARRIAGDIPFLEVFIATSITVCERRDPKGHYALARAGKISQFTGVSAPYEHPTKPDLTINTEDRSPESSASLIVRELLDNQIV